MFIYLVVSADNIKNSRRSSSRISPIGLAIRDAGIDHYAVYPSRAVIKVDGVLYESKFNGEFRKFQDNYLAGKPVSPIEGDLRFFPVHEVLKTLVEHLER